MPPLNSGSHRSSTSRHRSSRPAVSFHREVPEVPHASTASGVDAFDQQQQQASPRLLLFQQTEAAAALVATASSSATTTWLNSRSAPTGGPRGSSLHATLRPITPPIVPAPAGFKQDPQHAKFLQWQATEAERKRLGRNNSECRSGEPTPEELEEEAKAERRREMLQALPFVPSTNVEVLERSFMFDIRMHVEMSKRRVAMCRSGTNMAQSNASLSFSSTFMDKLQGGGGGAHRSPTSSPAPHASSRAVGIGVSPPTSASGSRPHTSRRHVPSNPATPHLSAGGGGEVFLTGISPTPSVAVTCEPKPLAAPHSPRRPQQLRVPHGISRPSTREGVVLPDRQHNPFACSLSATSGMAPHISTTHDAPNMPDDVVGHLGRPQPPPSRRSTYECIASKFETPEPWVVIIPHHQVKDCIQMAFRANCPLDPRKYRPTDEDKCAEYRQLFSLMSATDDDFEQMIHYRLQDVVARGATTHDAVKQAAWTPSKGEDGVYQHLVFQRVVQADSRAFYMKGSTEVERWCYDRQKVCEMKSAAVSTELDPTSKGCAGTGGAKPIEDIFRSLRTSIGLSLKEDLVHERSRIQSNFVRQFNASFAAVASSYNNSSGSSAASSPTNAAGSSKRLVNATVALSGAALNLLEQLDAIFQAGTAISVASVRNWVKQIPADALFMSDVVSICFSLCAGLCVPHQHWLDVLRERLHFAVSSRVIVALPDEGSDVKWILGVRQGELGPQCIRWVCTTAFHEMIEKEPSPATKAAVLQYIAKIPVAALLRALGPAIDDAVARQLVPQKSLPHLHAPAQQSSILHAEPQPLFLEGGGTAAASRNASSVRQQSVASSAYSEASADPQPISVAAQRSDQWPEELQQVPPSGVTPSASVPPNLGTTPSVRLVTSRHTTTTSSSQSGIVPSCIVGTALRLTKRQVAALPFPPFILEVLQGLREGAAVSGKQQGGGLASTSSSSQPATLVT